ncbi:MAG: TonB-dependent receptor, partial [Saprospiraceae bacterium]|nr:TonB-dependent receptor [Saprospiraceae bacterium]
NLSFSGVNDGNTTKTINIVTKSQARRPRTIRLRIYAGYGFEEKYQGGGNLNCFDGIEGISIIGMSNNINVQNFSSEDITGLTGNADRGGGFGRGGGGRGPGGFNWRQSGASLCPAKVGFTLTHAVGLQLF